MNPLCGCSCGEELKDGMRYGAIYQNRAHKLRALRQRQKERVAGWTDLCFTCGHPEEFHTLRPNEMGIDTGQDKIVWKSIDLGCSQLICACMGFEPLAELDTGELHVA